MLASKRFWATAALIIPLAMVNCMKPDRNADGIVSPADGPKAGGLDASHGGARIALPKIDFAALGKIGVDTTIIGPDSSVDTTVLAWFELTISGGNMPDMFFMFPLSRQAGTTFEITAIPSGSRVFHGRLLNSAYQPTHEGTTVAEIKAGAYSDVRLYLAKAAGSANVCVVIEGQPLPACAGDSIPHPYPPDSLGSCWYLGSDSLNGEMSLYPQYVNGSMGVVVTSGGARLPVTAWQRRGDTLDAIVARTGTDKKWIINGTIESNGVWMAWVSGASNGSAFTLYGKPMPCRDTVIAPPLDSLPPKDSLPPPKDTIPKDTLKAGTIPSANSSKGEATLCFEMRFDYAGKCESQGYAKMSFLAGKITYGNITVADVPSRTYSTVRGDYSQSPNQIHIQAMTSVSGVAIGDTLLLDGVVSTDRAMAKGDYRRLPSEKKGVWTMTAVVCGSWTPKYRDSTCVAPK